MQKLSLTHISERLSATREIVRELARCTSDAEAISMVSEALVVLFDLPRVIFIMQAGKPPAGHSYHAVSRNGGCHGGRWPPCGIPLLFRDRAPETVRQGSGRLSDRSRSHRALLFPLQESAEKIGLLLVLDIEPHPRDQALIELLAGRPAARLLHLRQEATLRRERYLSTRLLTMISSLAQAGNRETFLQKVLEMSAELANATSGS
ncbi:MAG: hypothetical protein MZW92_43680 [Comamonadaceae bacterium]|nr:hypothetical protein [Comamonadaceae bacterium]